ncbi:GntR family transcriptional regulator [Lacticaseibacillus jixianensis]|uniref:GntR family transcriptional regulator n=1 Tax=Lacticaseibacillus jixianensis TaxID=2486012 RepID=A0ABW4B7R8_9LACO|nr:GntR family transcriptional regulator [Lacticaseibacillus jixianensis]
MKFDASSIVPLYQQIADQFTAGILSGAFPEDTQIPSTTEVARTYAINPATVLKGMNVLVEAGLIEKRRGIGMFVTAGAQETLRKKRKHDFYADRITALVAAAKALDISKAELVAAIEEGYEQ